MMPTLTVADNADATGATATVTGSSGGTVTIKASQLVAVRAGQMWLPTWATVATRVGNGTAAVVLGNGYYFAYAVEGAAVSEPVYFWVTNGLTAVATRLRESVAARIALLNLPVQAIEFQIYPDESNTLFPSIILTPYNVSETEEQVMTVTTDIGRPIRVMICDRQDQYDHSTLPTYELWRQKIERAFSRQQLPGPYENVICKVDYDAIVNPILPKYQFMVSELVIRAVCREPRGLGA